MSLILPKELNLIIEAGIKAPSGENAQPWKTVWDGRTLKVFNVPERDTSLYNYQQFGSFISHGAFIENISIKASALGYFSTINFSDSINSNLIAEISFEKKLLPDKNVIDMASAISDRCTNRKPYKKEKIDPLILNTLQVQEVEGVTLMLTENQEEIKKLAWAGAINEKIMIGNQILHEFFYEHVSWTEEEDKRKRLGFYIKTLELPGPAKLIFKICKNWSTFQKVNKVLPIPKMVAMGNSQTYAAAGSMGIIVGPTKDKTAWINTGRLLERIWLIANSKGLALQPLAGTILLTNLLDNPNEKSLSQKDREELVSACKTIKSAFDIKDQKILFMFRLGYPTSAPSAKSRRLDLPLFIEGI